MTTLTDRVGDELHTVRALLGVVRDRPAPRCEDAVRRAAEALARCGSRVGNERWRGFSERLLATRGEALTALIDAILVDLAVPALGGASASDDERVLVVEADAAMGALMALALDEVGRSLTHVTSFSEARALLESGSFDVVVATVDLGGEDARDLLAWMRRTARFELVPVVLRAAAAADVAECYALGADAVLNLPVATHVLAASVSRLARRARREAALRHVDTSTGLLTEAGLRVAFERARAAAARTQVPMTFGLIEVGVQGPGVERDMAIVARRSAHSLRRADVLGRLGTTSIAVLMSGADALAGRRALERALSRVDGVEGEHRIMAEAVRPTDSWQSALERVAGGAVQRMSGAY